MDRCLARKVQLNLESWHSCTSAIVLIGFALNTHGQSDGSHRCALVARFFTMGVPSCTSKGRALRQPVLPLARADQATQDTAAAHIS